MVCMVCCVLSNYIGMSVLVIIPLDFNCNTAEVGASLSLLKRGWMLRPYYYDRCEHGLVS